MMQIKMPEYSWPYHVSATECNTYHFWSTSFHWTYFVYHQLKCAYVNNQTKTRNISISVKDTPVGFTAGMTSNSRTWEGDILVFPHVITNKGQGYSSSSGKFTAPRDGTYVFTVTAVSYSSNYLKLDIVHDGVRKVRTLSHGSASFQTGTNLVVLELDRGDAVWVMRETGQGYHSYSVPVTTFSGFILWGGSLNVELLCDLYNYYICFILKDCNFCCNFTWSVVRSPCDYTIINFWWCWHRWFINSGD